jgi:hypothetical protein
MTAAKAITVGYVNSGQAVKTSSNDNQNTSVGALFRDDSNVPDLSKIQLLAWTGIAVVLYLAHVVQQIGTSGSAMPQLPDIDSTLMVLMGLGQGAYLGKKLTTTVTPRLTGISPSSAVPPCDLTISGMSFGDARNDSIITIDGAPVPVIVPPNQWQNGQIRFTLPAAQPHGDPWQPGHPLEIGLIVGGQSSINSLPFTVAAPSSARVVPSTTALATSESTTVPSVTRNGGDTGQGGHQTGAGGGHT